MGGETVPPSLVLVFMAPRGHAKALQGCREGREPWHIVVRARLQAATGLWVEEAMFAEMATRHTLAGYQVAGRAGEEEGLLFEVCGVFILNLSLELHRTEDHVQLIAIP